MVISFDAGVPAVPGPFLMVFPPAEPAATPLSYLGRRMGNAMFSLLVCSLATLPLIR